MNIYEIEAALDEGSRQYGAMDQAMAYNTQVAPPSQGHSFPTQRQTTNNREKFWRGNAPVMIKVEYNGESLMLPVVAPNDESVSIKKPILDQTVNTIQDHQSTKADWTWKVNVLDERFRYQAPSNKAITMNALGSIRTRTTPNVYTYSDVRLHGTAINT